MENLVGFFFSGGRFDALFPLGVVSIPFSLLPNRTQKDEWYPLNTLSKAHQQLKVSVRIKAKFMVRKIARSFFSIF